MRRVELIRACELAAMVSGVAYVAQDLLAPPLVRLMIPDDGVPVTPALEEEGIPPRRCSWGRCSGCPAHLWATPSCGQGAYNHHRHAKNAKKRLSSNILASIETGQVAMTHLPSTCALPICNVPSLLGIPTVISSRLRKRRE